MSPVLFDNSNMCKNISASKEEKIIVIIITIK